ncbi:acetyltransferase [Kitasatospora sp. NBC_01287]|uniref:GNAT family N-acetyltransferase n=1 Tax=Kitasatospora sp. NBC_01287 TaxID=2903573 RepID=UPI00224CA2EE|nr:GNAT family N-acetyltransferase [Kitasatospora sp. NBC_01287]MCX4751587.1 acetyltransferase [Kitasatospora sp. NBC_01287]
MTNDQHTQAATTEDASPAGRTFEAALPGFGTVRIRPLDPAGDAATVHGWVDQEWARFWGMVGHSREQVRDIYAFVDSLPSHHAYLALRDDTPVALFQTYRPEHDPLGEHYQVAPGDLGIHLLVAPTEGNPRPGYTETLVSVFLAFVLADPAVRRLVAEPDARNEKSIARLLRTGFELGPEIQLPEKRARLVFLTREAGEALRHRAAASH